MGTVVTGGGYGRKRLLFVRVVRVWWVCVSHVLSYAREATSSRKLFNSIGTVLVLMSEMGGSRFFHPYPASIRIVFSQMPGSVPT